MSESFYSPANFINISGKSHELYIISVDSCWPYDSILMTFSKLNLKKTLELDDSY